jgi:hypothetical protein
MKNYEVKVGGGLMYEDELPEDLPKILYDWWFDLSEIVDGVRMGPTIKPSNQRLSADQKGRVL